MSLVRLLCPRQQTFEWTDERGDLDGYAVWKRILRAVGELQKVEPGSSVVRQ